MKNDIAKRASASDQSKREAFIAALFDALYAVSSKTSAMITLVNTNLLFSFRTGMCHVSHFMCAINSNNAFLGDLFV